MVPCQHRQPWMWSWVVNLTCPSKMPWKNPKNKVSFTVREIKVHECGWYISLRTHYPLILNPAAACWSWAHSTFEVTQGSVQLRTKVMGTEPLQSGTSSKGHDNSFIYLAESISTKSTGWRARSKEFELF